MGQSEPRKILLVWIGRFGDLLVSGPFIAALRAKYPRAEITLLARGYVKELAALLPGLDKVLALPSFSSPLSLPRFAGKMLSGFDLCVDLNSSYSRTSGFLCLLSRAPERVSFDKFRACWFYNRTVAAPAEDEHMLSRYGRLAEFFGAPYQPALRVLIPETAQADAQKVLDGLKDGGPLVLVHPGNFKKYDHRWPEEKFLELCRRLSALPGKISLVLMAGPGEEAPVKAMLAQLPGAKYLPPLPAPQTAAVMSKCSLVVVSATGTMHLAAALDVPLVCFHSEYTYKCWRPMSPKSVSLSSGEWNSCRSITVDAAWEAVSAVLSKKP